MFVYRVLLGFTVFQSTPQSLHTLEYHPVQEDITAQL